jgi:hypothetical protein
MGDYAGNLDGSVGRYYADYDTDTLIMYMEGNANEIDGMSEILCGRQLTAQQKEKMQKLYLKLADIIQTYTGSFLP